MKISVVNKTYGVLADEEVQVAIRAINRQIQEDFAPYWNLSGQLRLEGTTDLQPDVSNPVDMRGDAVIYIWDEADVEGALGYHDTNYRGVPYGFVFIDIATEMGENWTVTLSHEALELIGDRQANLLVSGPHPEDENRNVYHWREMCDAVQTDTYSIDGVELSNFVLPLYFTPDAEPGSRNDFLGKGVESFKVRPGGYIGYFDPQLREHGTFPALRSDADVETMTVQEHRFQRKNKARRARRGSRYAAGLAIGGKPQDVAVGSWYPVKGAGKLKVQASRHIEINKLDAGQERKLKRAGYYAYDITQGAEGFGHLASSLQQEELLEEILGIDIPASDSPEPIAVSLKLEHEQDEAVYMLLEIDGVLLCHLPKATNCGESEFNIQLIPEVHPEGVRGSLIRKGGRAIVRFVKQKVGQAVENLKDNAVEFLAETIEKKAFKKDKAARLVEFVERSGVKNKTRFVIQENIEPLKSGETCLLFIHGIFSSVKGAFGDLLISRFVDKLESRDLGVLGALKKRYDRIIGFDHWTVAKDTLENAKDLLALLPNDIDIDIVCHSRGAGVTRCLLEHPELEPKLSEKQLRIGNVLFVAGAAQGSGLAKPGNVDKLVNLFSIAQLTKTAYVPGLLIAGLMKAVQFGVENFPGISAMDPDSPLIAAINEATPQVAAQYIYVRSNYEPKNRLGRWLDQLALDRFVFNEQMNDGVVPYDGAGTFDRGISRVVPGVEFSTPEEPNVFHTQFFKQLQVQKLMLEVLIPQTQTTPAEVVV